MFQRFNTTAPPRVISMKTLWILVPLKCELFVYILLFISMLILRDGLHPSVNNNYMK